MLWFFASALVDGKRQLPQACIGAPAARLGCVRMIDAFVTKGCCAHDRHRNVTNIYAQPQYEDKRLACYSCSELFVYVSHGCNLENTFDLHICPDHLRNSTTWEWRRCSCATDTWMSDRLAQEFSEQTNHFILRLVARPQPGGDRPTAASSATQ